jgi:hypothetical protein
MKVETLEELRAAFEGWRRKKRYRQEPVPSALLTRAQRAIDVYGLGVVARATKLEHGRLKAMLGRQTEADATVPSYSRMELALPVAAVAEQPFAEVETPAGLKVRIFAHTPEAVGLITSLLVMGGAR